MRLLECAGLYAIIGLASAIALARRAPRPSATDLALVVVLWPLYLPVMVAAQTAPAAELLSEHARLGAAIASIGDPEIARLMPTRAQLDALAARLTSLDARGTALDAALEREPPPPEGDRGVHADGARKALARLAELRERSRADRDDLAGLVRRLRVQITVIGFAGASSEDARDIAAEIAARVDGVDAAFDPETRDEAVTGRR